MRLFIIFFSFTSLLLPFSYAAISNPVTSSIEGSVEGSIASSIAGQYDFAGQSDLTNIDFTTVRALKDIDAATKTQFGNVTVTEVSLNQGELSDREIVYFAEKMSEGFRKINASSSTDGTIIDFSEDAFQKIDASLKERVKNQDLKEIKTPYFSHLIIKKNDDSFSLTMVVFETDSRQQIWSKSWENFNPTRKQSSVKVSNLLRFVSDAGLVLFIDDYYFFGLTTSFTGEFVDIVGIGIGTGVLLSIVNNLSTTVNVSGVDYAINANIFSFAVPLSLVVTISLIDSSLRKDFSIFDMELHFEPGIMFGVLNISGNIINNAGRSVYFDDRSFFWRPIMLLGLNFVFIERLYIRAGVDFGFLVRNTAALEDPATYVTPFVGIGYRFDARHR